MSVYLPPSSRALPASRAAGRSFVRLKAASMGANGTFTGYGAVFGNLDDGGDVIERGFFAPVLADFLREGFISWNHDWSRPVAVPTSAREDNYGLLITASFHSDEASQQARTVAAERLAAGLTMGLSIGYEIGPGGATFESDGRHLRTASRLFEVGLVMVPMNRSSIVSTVKSAAPTPATAGPLPIVEVVPVPAGWIPPLVKEVVRRAALWSCWSLGTDADFDVHYFDKKGGDLAAESKRIGFGQVRSFGVKDSEAGADLTGLHGFFQPIKPEAIWIAAGRSLDETAITTAHEIAHRAGHDESDARAFADGLLSRLGGAAGLLSRRI